MQGDDREGRTKQWEDREGALLIHHVGTEGGTALLPGPGGWVVGGVGEALDGGASSFASSILHSDAGR